MATTVKLKRSETGSSTPTTSDIAVGEVALNTADQKIYVRDSSDNIKIVGVGADATASVKGVASFSSSNFTVSSGAVSLNADQSGTITGVGTISTGVWNGTAIGSQYGGTGQNFSSSTGVTYFNSGTASVVSMATKGQLLVGDGSGAPQSLSVGTNDYVLTADSSTATGLSWKEAASGGGGANAKDMFFFTATSGQTTFSGSDDDTNTLAYTSGVSNTNIYLNGVLLDDSDYTATNGTSVVLSVAAAADDILTVEAFDNVSLGALTLVDDISPQLGGNLDVNGNSIVSVSAGNISITPDTTGSVIIDGLSHPQADGTAGQFLKTDGAGQLAFATVDTDLVNDTTPQLGGDLDGQGNNIYTLQGNIGSDSGDYITFTTNTRMDVFVNGSNEFRFESDGDFHADGNVIAYSTTISDVALKSDIEVIPNALDKISMVRGVTFTRHNGKQSAGIIAQELEKVLPQAINETELPLQKNDGKKYKTVEYDAIHGLLIEAIKELTNRLNKLELKQTPEEYN